MGATRRDQALKYVWISATLRWATYQPEWASWTACTLALGIGSHNPRMGPHGGAEVCVDRAMNTREAFSTTLYRRALAGHKNRRPL